MIKKFIGIAALAVALMCIGAFAQEHGTPAAEPQGTATPGNPNQGADARLSKESKAAEGDGNQNVEEEEEEHTNLKQSASVKWIASKTGMSPSAAYWVLVGFNFAVLAGAIFWFSKSSIPAAMRDRTATIQRGIEEARKASTEASARLASIEQRLAKLDVEVSELRAAAEADFSAEEQRIKQQAEADARRVIETAEQEIATASRSAARELKAFAADLAVGIAEKKIKVDASTDEALVRGFAAQLGKDGK